MGITDRVEAFINELIRQQEEDEWLEIGRNELASIFGCVPSQINYVISTRFSPERGYTVQSRRGGGGCIRIRRIYGGEIHSVIDKIGDAIDERTARTAVMYLHDNGMIDKGAAEIINAAVSDKSLAGCGSERNAVRASILKNALAAAGI